MEGAVSTGPGNPEAGSVPVIPLEQQSLRAREQAPHREPRDRTWVTRAGGGETSQQKREYDEVALESLDPKRTGGNESHRGGPRGRTGS